MSMGDLISFIILILLVALFRLFDVIMPQLDRIERRLEVITPAFECAGYAYNYEVKEYRIEESVKDSLNLP